MGTKQRIIRSKIKIETFVENMKSPEKKNSTKGNDKWNIPPVVSKWKNNKGYTIPLKYRCLQEGGEKCIKQKLSDNFLRLSEALHNVEIISFNIKYGQKSNHLAEVTKEKCEKERKLRDMALSIKLRIS